MFVDDEDSIIEIAQRILPQYGYDIFTFSNGVQAYQELQKHPDRFDLIITDMSMPYMTGAQLAQRGMEIRPDIPVILCTGHSELVNRKKTLAMGIKAYCEKPLNMEHLIHTARKVLDTAKINGIRALFVDDVQCNVDLAKLVLERVNCRVTVVTSGQEALDLFTDTPDKFDIIITDLNMPEITGLELAKKLLIIRPDIPILLVTGDEDILDKKRVKSSGILATLGKPLEEDVLVRAISETIKDKAVK